MEEDSKGKRSMTAILPSSPDTIGRERKRLVSEWILRFGVNYKEEITPARIALWQDELADIPLDVLEPAFRATIRTSRFFPTIADIRSHIQQADETFLELEAEEAWQEALGIAADFGSDYPIASASNKVVDPLISAGVRAAGGWHWIANCRESELQWAKKNFIENWKKQRAAPKLLGLSNPRENPLLEAVRILAQQKALPEGEP